MFADKVKSVISELGIYPFTAAYCELMLQSPLPSPEKTAVETFIATVNRIVAIRDDRVEPMEGTEEGSIQATITYGENWLDTVADKAPEYIEKRRTEIRAFVDGLRRNPLWSHI